MEKKARMTKLEQQGLKELVRKEAGLRILIEHTSVVAEELAQKKGAIHKQMQDRLGIKAEPIHVNLKTGEIKWHELD